MIVVTGMHRSGTSLAALILRELGVDFGPEAAMYDADDWNAKGYLERTDVVDLNSRAITGFDRTTGKGTQIASQVSYLAQSAAGRSDRCAQRLESMAVRVAELGNALGSSAVKDPRFCLTYTAWDKHTSISGLVLALRHPAASVASLQRRNRIPAALGHRFWRWHMEAIISQIDEETLVLRQEDLIGPGLDEAIERTQRWAAKRGITVTGDPRTVIDRSLVHHSGDGDEVPAASIDLWNALIECPSFR